MDASLPVVLDNPLRPDEVPPGCNPNATYNIVHGFLDAFNRDDTQQLARYFDLEHFTTYLAGHFGDGHVVTDFESDGNQQALLAYVARRHTQHEQIRLVQVDINQVRGDDSIGITYQLQRWAADLQRSAIGGHGEIDCRTQKIEQWISDYRPAPATPTAPGTPAALTGRQLFIG